MAALWTSRPLNIRYLWQRYGPVAPLNIHDLWQCYGPVAPLSFVTYGSIMDQSPP